MAESSSHPGAIVVAAIVGAIGVVIAAYIGLRKPTEKQIVTSEQYKALVHESASYRARVEDLTRQVKSLGDTQSKAMSQREVDGTREITQLKERIAEQGAQASSLRSERDSLARELERFKASAGVPPARAESGGTAADLKSTPVDLKKMVGRWVGVAECRRGAYPTSIDVTGATGAELSVKYSDSLNGGSRDSTLILLPSNSNQISFAFRIKDDRFIVMKNGSKLLLERSGLLVSPSDPGKQCKVALTRS